MNDTLNDRLIDELVVQVGGERGWTDDRMPLARWDLQAALDRAGLVLHEAGEQGDAGRIVVSRDDLELVLSDVRGTGEPRPGDIPEGWSSARARLRAVLASPAVTGEQGDGQRQRNELLNTFAPTEPTVDDLPGSRIDGTLLHQLAVAVMTATTEAQEGMKPSDEALRHRDRLVRRAQAEKVHRLTARAEKAEARLAVAERLLREAGPNESAS